MSVATEVTTLYYPVVSSCQELFIFYGLQASLSALQSTFLILRPNPWILYVFRLYFQVLLRILLHTFSPLLCDTRSYSPINNYCNVGIEGVHFARGTSFACSPSLHSVQRRFTSLWQYFYRLRTFQRPFFLLFLERLGSGWRGRNFSRLCLRALFYGAFPIFAVVSKMRS